MIEQPLIVPKDPIFDLVGNTPLIPLTNLFRNSKNIKVFAKLEYVSPSGSIKDRIVAHILSNAMTDGILQRGCVVIEATSGNTGASLALFCARLGFPLILTTPAKTSQEKQMHMRMLGAQLHICPPAKYGSRDHYQMRAAKLAKEISGAFWMNQYENPGNSEAHYRTTGPEIWTQMQGKIDWFVTGGSTGGTISGVGRYLKERDSNIRVLLPDPIGSVFFGLVTTGVADYADVAPYQVEGVGKDHVPTVIDISVVDQAMQYDDDLAFKMCGHCARVEGILPGLSAGGNLAGVQWLVEHLEGPARIVTLIQDAGTNYMSKLSAVESIYNLPDAMP